jgi:hypothetical protein
MQQMQASRELQRDDELQRDAQEVTRDLGQTKADLSRMQERARELTPTRRAN